VEENRLADCVAAFQVSAAGRIHLDDSLKSPIIRIVASIVLINATFRMLQSGMGKKDL
jgi:hypothetical protein